MRSALAVALCGFICVSATGAAERSHWATGTAVQQALAQQIDVVWAGNPLRQALANLSRAQRVAILLDRRVDPEQKVDLKLNGVPMEAALRKIADHCGLGIARLGPVVYVGPVEAAERLPAVAAALERDVRRLPAAARQKFVQQRPLAWDDFANPRDLLAELGQQSGIDIAGLEQLPHDLWAEADLPPLSLVDRMTLIAAEFDLSFTVATDGRAVKLVPVTDDLGKTAATPPRAVSPQSAKKRTTTKTSTGKSSAAKSTAAKPPETTEEPPIKRLVVKEKPLEPVLRELGRQLDLEINFDRPAIEAAGISLDQRVSAVVEQATVDDLFHELLKSTGLKFHRRKNVVEITPAQ